MKKVLRITLFTFSFLSIFILFSSCREDIITPNTPVTNINEPVTSNDYNYYSFTINAENASYYVMDHPNFNYGSTRVYYAVSNHSNGSATITLKDKNNNIRYRSNINSDSDGITHSLEGVIPGTVEIDFNHFTGILQLQLTGYL